MIHYNRHELFSKSFSSLLNALETVNQAEINMSSKTRELQKGIPSHFGTNPYMSPYVETVSCGEYFREKNSQGPTNVHFFHKNK